MGEGDRLRECEECELALRDEEGDEDDEERRREWRHWLRLSRACDERRRESPSRDLELHLLPLLLRLWLCDERRWLERLVCELCLLRSRLRSPSLRCRWEAGESGESRRLREQEDEDEDEEDVGGVTSSL